MSKAWFYIFSIFFGDKYILENFASNLFNFLNSVYLQLQNTNKKEFINIFKFILIIIFYLTLISIVLFLI